MHMVEYGHEGVCGGQRCWQEMAQPACPGAVPCAPAGAGQRVYRGRSGPVPPALFECGNDNPPGGRESRHLPGGQQLLPETRFLRRHGGHERIVRHHSFNSPTHVLPSLMDSLILRALRGSCRTRILYGQRDHELPGSCTDLAALLKALEVPHRLEVWGRGIPHGWPAWRALLPHVLARWRL